VTARRKSRKGRGGRPPKPAAERQSEAVMVRLTPAERAALERAAGGEALGAFLRGIVLRTLGRLREPPR
jgi:hypothetical protein